MTIRISENKKWVDKKTRDAWKYSPVTVEKPTTEAEKLAMVEVVERRIAICRELALDVGKGSSWFGFLYDRTRRHNFRAHNVPIFVLSGGNAKRIKNDFDNSTSDYLAWHPAMARNEPVYLFVHKSDYRTYGVTLSAEFAKYRNFFLVGWDGGALTGFGAARAAVLAYADNLSYAPQRLLMMDQDVVAVENTRYNKPEVLRDILKLHERTGNPVIGYGLGYAERKTAFPPISKQLELESDKSYLREVVPKKVSPFTPTQQYVSIKAPFRKKDDGVYPAFMVAGGEDMLMTQRTQGYKKDEKGKMGNATILHQNILKKRLAGDGDTPNRYWNVDRIATLDKLFENESDTRVSCGGSHMSLGALCEQFVAKRYIDRSEKSTVSALIIERIILRANQTEGAWPAQYSGTVLNQHP